MLDNNKNQSFEDAKVIQLEDYRKKHLIRRIITVILMPFKMIFVLLGKLLKLLWKGVKALPKLAVKAIKGIARLACDHKRGTWRVINWLITSIIVVSLAWRLFHGLIWLMPIMLLLSAYFVTIEVDIKRLGIELTVFFILLVFSSNIMSIIGIVAFISILIERGISIKEAGKEKEEKDLEAKAKAAVELEDAKKAYREKAAAKAEEAEARKQAKDDETEARKKEREKKAAEAKVRRTKAKAQKAKARAEKSRAKAEAKA